MKIVKFFKTTVIGGLVVIIPLAVIAYVIGDAVISLAELTRPFTAELPFDQFTNSIIVMIAVIIEALLICFLAGYLLNTLWGAAIKNWFEKNLLERIPMYSTLRGLTKQFAGIKNADYPVVEADLYDSEGRVLGILVDEIPDGRKVVYIPSSPVVTIGQTHLLPGDRVTITELSLTDAIGCLSQMGFEARKLYAEK